MSALSRFAEENGGLTLNEANAAWDALMKERDRCAKIVRNVRPGVPRWRIVELIYDGNHNPPDEVIR